MPTPNRITAAYVERLADLLGPRDLAIIASLDRVRIASTRQIKRLHFHSGTELSNARQARRTLQRLTDLRVVSRLARRIGGVRAGSAGYLYSLDVAGQRLARSGGPVREGRIRPPWTPSSVFLAHALAVTELYVRLVEYERNDGLDLLAFDAEPASWRSFLSPFGGRATLKPDAYIRLGVGEYETAWFVEVDRATEPRPILSKKLDLYRQYWSSGREQDRTGLFPRVLVLVPDARRHEALIDLVGRQPVDAWPLFRVALYEHAMTVLAEQEQQP